MTEIEALGKCTEILDALYLEDSDAVAGVISYIWDRHKRNLDKSIRALQDQREKHVATIEVYKKLKEAEVMECIKQNSDGKFFIDWESVKLKETKNVK